MFRKIVSPVRLFTTQRSLCSKATTPSNNGLVLTEVDNKTGYVKVTLNRAPVNSLNLELMTEVARTIDELERSKIKGMVLTSFSNKVFCAGLDIKEMINPNPDRLRAVWISLQDMWAKLYGCSFPTVAVINGHAPAGGCLLAICCEYRIMYPNFGIGLNETALGIVVPPWLQVTMRNTIGARETEIGCTKGTIYNSKEALEIGLVDELASNREEAMTKSTGFLDTFKNMSPYARSATKLMLRNRDIDDLNRYREDDINRFMKNVLNPDFQQGLNAYVKSLKKRKTK